ncbi:mediator of RNA polymerase II transcription subunit 26-like isoform X2 [Daphnia pulicaria]|uniref:mediator of RNA polymerase II transcription subunit 26-like isoform X2 n=1 Tax=Daphnia pulicaria TaxID=35523 RepID=UPI001EE9DEBD|nr:mediator of RNA polymerase II transcription subunit 26-like isoform X2 [Daphnia pulicaria]
MQQQPSPPHSPSQIKEKLLQALDRDYHVVDMALALEAVSLLEKTPVTKEALETTRLGRLVNEMRKKTKNDSLARRAKDLVRRWRDMVSKPSENGTGGTGQGPGASLVNHLRVAGVKNSVSSPALCEMGRTASPALPRPVHNLAISPTSPAFRGVTLSPALQRKSSQSTGGLQLQQQRVISPSNSVASNTSTSPGLSFSLSQTHSNSSRPSTPSSLVVKSKAISPGPGRPMIDSSEFPSKTNHHRGIKRTRDNDEETMTGFELTGKRSRGSNGVDWPWMDECSRDSNLSWSGDSLRMTNHSALGGGEDRSISSSSKASRPLRGRSKAEVNVKPEPTSDVLREKFASIARVSKVKTTQELLEDLARRSGSPNLIVKPEIHSVHQQQHQQQPLTVPPSNEARQWPDAKQEILDKFLRSHSTDRRSDGITTTSTVVSKPKTTATPAINDPVAEIYARLPPLDPAIVASIWKEEVKPETEELETDSSVPERPVTDEDVDLLHNGSVDDVNGSRDINGEFHQWHETVTVASYHGDPLHLLPYVVIE